ncbi:MAG TPA: serine/threonine-protein kinase [Nannocystaceae bacterium]|nr:serine/threonine-protein kinase [Nannocystaceae bacterium]
MTSPDPYPSSGRAAATGEATTAAANRDSFSDVDSQLGELVRELAAPPADRERVHLLAPGSRIAEHFEVVRKLGMGGMGVVYLARDERLDRVVAVKLLAPRRGEDGSRREAGTARLEREAQAMAQLAHPNVVTVHEVGRHDGGVYVAMEYVDGGTARQWANERTRSIAEIVEVYLQAARGLAAAHAAGFVHRDFKPDNMLIGRDADGGIGRVRVADFGLARTWAGSGEHAMLDVPPSSPIALELRSRPSVPQLTATDAVVGTPGYMAPEQFSGTDLGPAIDQFAWGVALFEALFGERPYGTLPSWAATADDLRVPTRGGTQRVPGWLKQIVLRAILLDPAARHPSMHSVVVALERGRLRGRRVKIAAVATVAIAAAVGAGIGLGSSTREAPCRDAEALATARWNAGVREQLDAAFAGDDALTQRAWAVAAPLVDDWTRGWSEHRRAACIATRVHGSQSEQLLDRSVACLDSRLADLGTLLTGLATEPQTRAAVDTHVGELRDTSVCLDTAYLLAQVQPPEDPQVRAEVERITEELRRIRIGYDFDRGDAEHLAELTAAARRTEHAPIIASVEIETARTDMLADRHADAAQRLRDAYFLARKVGDDENADDAATTLAYLVGSIGTDRATAEIWLDHVEADLERGTVADERRVALELTRCQVLQRAGADVEAVDAARAALAAAKTPLRMLNARAEVAAALDGAGHHREAIAEYDTLLDEAVTLYGPDHTRVAMVLTNRGLAHYYLQQNERAIADQQRAYAIHLAHDGGTTAAAATVLLNLGLAQLGAGHYDDAIGPIEQARAIWKRVGAKAEQALALAALGWIELERDDPERALEHYRGALAIDEEVLPPGHPQISAEWSHVADAQLALERAEESVASYQHALAIWAAPELRDHPASAIPHAGIARAYLALERWDDALREAESAIELAARADVEPATLVRARWVRARVWAHQGREQDAITEARAAATLGHGIDGFDGDEPIDAWLREHDPE